MTKLKTRIVMFSALDLLSNFGVEINSIKKDLILFTTKTKIPKFKLPRLKDYEIPLTRSTKYLGIIIDSKLSWKISIEQRVQKATLIYNTSYSNIFFVVGNEE